MLVNGLVEIRVRTADRSFEAPEERGKVPECERKLSGFALNSGQSNVQLALTTPNLAGEQAIVRATRFTLNRISTNKMDFNPRALHLHCNRCETHPCGYAHILVGVLDLE